MRPRVSRVPQIVALGGGGFSMEKDSSLLDDYILSLTSSARPRVCFLPTASGDADHYVVRFYRRFSPQSRLRRGIALADARVESRVHFARCGLRRVDSRNLRRQMLAEHRPCQRLHFSPPVHYTCRKALEKSLHPRTISR